LIFETHAKAEKKQIIEKSRAIKKFSANIEYKFGHTHNTKEIILHEFEILIILKMYFSLNILHSCACISHLQKT